MSDLREAVAKAIADADVADGVNDDLAEWRWRVMDDDERSIYFRRSDAAIAAYEAHQPEPTEAEVAAGRQAYDDYLRHARSLMIVPSRVEQGFAVREAIRAAFAARTTRPGGQR
jgi:hypothetical protein